MLFYIMERVKKIIAFLEEDGFVISDGMLVPEDRGTIFSHADECNLEKCHIYYAIKQTLTRPNLKIEFNSCLAGHFIINKKLYFSFKEVQIDSREDNYLKVLEIAKEYDYFRKFNCLWSEDSFFFCEYKESIDSENNILNFNILQESQPYLFHTFFLSSSGIEVSVSKYSHINGNDMLKLLDEIEKSFL